MNETVTVDEAIRKGHRMVNYPIMFIMLGTIALCFFLGIQKILPPWIIAAGIAISFISAWLYWSIMITKWRLWAFDSVRNVHELKKRAIQEKLIWSDNSLFEKTEIRRSGDKAKWNSLQTKFKQQDVFFDNLTISNETIIFYSKGKNLFEMIIMIACLFLGIYLLLNTGSYILGIAFSIAGIYFGYK